MAGVLPNIFVEVELSGVGAGWTSLSADVLISKGITIRHGIQDSGPADLVAAIGTGSFYLNNSERNSGSKLGYYSLYHANKRSGWALGIGCRIRMQDPTTSTFYTRLTGRVDSIEPVPGSNAERSVAVTMVDWMDEAERWTLVPEIGEQIDKRSDEILTAILLRMPRQPVSTSFDVGSESYAYALDVSSNTNQSAMAEFGNLARSEVGPIFVKGDGTLRLEGRHSRLLDTTSDWTLTDADFTDISLPSTRDEILNTVRTTYHPKIVDPQATVIVYEQANAIFVDASATKTLLGTFRDPDTGDEIGATGILAQVSGVDYIANTLDDGMGTNITSDFVITVATGAAGVRFSVTNNNASAGWLTRNRLFGKRVLDRGSLQKEARNSTSVTAYGENVVELDMVYQGSDDVAQGAADYLLAKYKDPLAQIRTITVPAKTTTILTQVLSRDISDRLTISETVTGANNSYFINGEELRITEDGFAVATYILAPAQDPFSGLYWILGTSVLGTGTLPAPF